jgi:hypothetical protein
VGVSVPSQDVVLRASPIDDDRTLSVTVTTPDGKAASRSEVRIVGPGVDRTVATNANGLVRIEGLSALMTSFVALARDGSGFVDSPRTRLVPNGQSIRLALCRSVVITGTVLGADGDPVPGARVEATPAGRTRGVVGIADKVGRWSLRVPEAKTYSLRASLKDPFSGDFKRVVLEGVTGGDVVLRLR